MQDKSIIQIPFDIRNILPNINEQVNQEELIDKVPINQFIEKADEINQLHLGNAGELHEDISHIIQVDDSNLKAIGLGCLTGIHTFNGNYKKAIASINQALNLNTNEEVYAYLLTEYANLLRQLMRVDEAIALLDQASHITTNENLEWRIKTYQGYCLRYSNKDKSLFLLKESLRHYFDTNEHARYNIVLRHIGVILLQYNEIDEAKKYLEEAKKLAERYGHQSINWGTLNDLGWIHVIENEHDIAKEIFLELYDKDKGPYYNSLVIQNLGYIEFECENFVDAIKYHQESLKITSNNEIYDMLFEDYYKLGMSYEKIGNYGEAEKYYNEGVYTLQLEQNQFDSILQSGYRGKLLEQFIKFQSYKPVIEHVSKYSKTFDFIENKNYNEILGIFQKNLLSLHRNKNKTIKLLCDKLGISIRLYFVYQKRLNIAGRNTKLDNYLNEHLINYLYSLIDLDWRSAIKQFDTDLYRYLLGKYHYNKTKISEILDVSVLTVINKTADID